MKKLVLIAAAFSLAGTVPAWADEDTFAAVCPELTEERHPEIEDAESACTCLIESASDEEIASLETAETPSDISDETKATMQACGYTFEE